MRYIVIAPACNAALPGTDPIPNRIILRQAVKVAKKLSAEGHVVIFTDNYMVRPTTLPKGVSWVQTPYVKSQVAFLRRLSEYLDTVIDEYKLVAIMTPHYCRRWNRDAPKVLGVDVPIDPGILKVPIRNFFSENGADARSRHFLVWLTREALIELLCCWSWDKYAQYTG